jgi:thiol-disulfide isomerase/thioredoxin
MSFVASYGALWLLVVFLTLISIGLLREVTELRRAWGGLSPASALRRGELAPHFSARVAGSERRITQEYFVGRTSVIVFLTPHCGTCLELAPSIRSLPIDASISKLAVCKGTEDDCAVFLTLLGDDIPLLVDTNGEIGEVYGLLGYPAAFVVNAQRRLLRFGYPRSAADCAELVAAALASTDGSLQPAA